MQALGAILDGVEADSPGALGQRRRAAAAYVRAHGLPQPSDEAWKYTSLAALRDIAYRPATPRDAQAVSVEDFAALAQGVETPYRAVLVNGYFRADLSTLDRLPAGCTVRSLAAVLASAPDAQTIAGLVPDAASAPAFTALNTALLADGLVIELAPDAELGEPLHIVAVANSGTPLLRTARIIVRAGAGARARIVEEYLGMAADSSLTNVVTDLLLDRDAVIHHHRLQNEPITTAHIGRVSAQLGAGSELYTDSVVFGGALTRVDIEVTLAARGARTRLNGLFAATGSQHMDHHTVIDHAVGDTHSEELYRGILDGRSRGVFNGKVIVRSKAQRITSRQASNNLLLSRQAEIDTKPEFEIYADDVSCAHGATVGQLDPAALFYLRSRGIAEAEARALLTYAFAEQVVDAIPLRSLRQAIEERFIGKRALSELTASLNPPCDR